MAIQMRRGEYDDFDASKMLAGELAVVVSGDPETEGGALYVATAAGNATRVAFANEIPGDATTTSDGLMSAADKAKLDGVAAGAQANVIESISVNGTAVDVNNKNAAISIPQASSDSAGLMTASDKTKLDGIETGANAYSLPAATTATLGGVKPDGTTVTVDADGTIHSAGGSGGSDGKLTATAESLLGTPDTAQWATRESTGSGTATVRSVQGATVAYNQYISVAAMQDNVSTLQQSGNTCTVTALDSATQYFGVRLFGPDVVTAGHKYLALIDVDTSTLTSFKFVQFGQAGYTGTPLAGNSNMTESGRLALIYEAQQIVVMTGYVNAVANTGETLAGQTFAISNPMFFDLTAMFGSGNEPTTVAKFEQMFPAAYYPYSAPTLKPVRIAGIESTDANGDALDSIEWPTQTLRAAGNVRDTLYSDHVETRVGAVDLGTLTWTMNTSPAFFSAVIPTKANPVTSMPNAECAALQPVTFNDMYKNFATIADDSFAISNGSNSRVYVKKTSVANAAALATALSGVPLYYELATPTTTPISPALPMTYRVEQGGTENIIVPSGEVSAAPVLTVAEGESAADVVMDALACIATPDGPVATSNHAINTYLTMQGKLYKVTSAIAVGETIKSGTNVSQTTVMAELIARTA